MLVEFQCGLDNFWCTLGFVCIFGQFPMDFLVHFLWVCWSISYGHYELVGFQVDMSLCLSNFSVCVCYLIFGVYVGFFVRILTNFRWI